MKLLVVSLLVGQIQACCFACDLEDSVLVTAQSPELALVTLVQSISNSEPALVVGLVIPTSGLA